MPDYRVFIMTAEGHVLSRVDIVCSDEDHAKEEAKKLVDGHDVELWQLDRKLATFQK